MAMSHPSPFPHQITHATDLPPSTSPQPLPQFMMVSFTRGDVDDGATRADVLSSYKPDTTTVYDTSAAARLSYLSSEHLKPGTTFDPPLNLTPAAQTYTREVLADRVNAPPKYTLSPQQAAAEAAGTRVVAAGDTWKAPQPKSPSCRWWGNECDSDCS